MTPKEITDEVVLFADLEIEAGGDPQLVAHALIVAADLFCKKHHIYPTKLLETN